MLVNWMRTAPVDFKKLSDVVDRKVVKNTKFNTPKTKVNNLEKKKSWFDYFNSH